MYTPQREGIRMSSTIGNFLIISIFVTIRGVNAIPTQLARLCWTSPTEGRDVYRLCPVWSQEWRLPHYKWLQLASTKWRTTFKYIKLYIFSFDPRNWGRSKDDMIQIHLGIGDYKDWPIIIINSLLYWGKMPIYRGKGVKL